MKSLAVASLLFLAVSASAQKRFVYLNNQSQPNTVTAFEVNSNGTLTQLTNSPFSTGGMGAEGPIESMAIVPTMSGPILYAANGGDPSISALTVDPKTGDLTPIAGSPFLINDSSGTYDMAASPNRRFLFATNEASTSIHVYAVSPRTGSLTEVAGSPFPTAANISGLYVTANGKFLLAAGNSIDAVEVFAIASSGAITQVTGSPFAANSSVSDVRSNCASDRVFAADNGSDLIDAYTMSSDGALTPVHGSPFYNGATGNGPDSFDLAIAPNGRFLFTSDSFSGDVTSFSIAPNGALSQNGALLYTAGFLGGTTITERGDLLYVVDFTSGSVDAAAIAPNGTLTSLGAFSGGQISPGGEANSVIAYPPESCSGAAGN